MTDSSPHVLVAGASGVIGAAAVEHFARLPGWQVTALSRRLPAVSPDLTFRHVSVDLQDAAACAAGVADLPPVTHLIYAAVAEAPGLATGWRDPERIAQNGAMFANLLLPLAKAETLRHVSILQGTKAYGAHVHPVTLPLKESSPRDPHENFYWLHEDLVRETAAQHGFAFSIFRPQILMGWAPGAAMNPVAGIGAYAALCKELGLPFALPGSATSMWEMVDASLMAEVMGWAATAPAAAGETFNVTNGDVFVLGHAWPDLARKLGLDTAGEAPESFRKLFAEPASQAAWASLVERHGLAPLSLDQLLGESHAYLDLLLASRIADKTLPVMVSTIKLRQAGFPGCRDSFASLVTQLQKMVDLRLLPPLFS